MFSVTFYIYVLVGQKVPYFKILSHILRPFQEKMCACAINRTPNLDLQVCCYSQVIYYIILHSRCAMNSTPKEILKIIFKQPLSNIEP